MYSFSEYVFWGCFGKQDQFMVKIFFHMIYFDKHLNKFQKITLNAYIIYKLKKSYSKLYQVY